MRGLGELILVHDQLKTSLLLDHAVSGLSDIAVISKKGAP